MHAALVSIDANDDDADLCAKGGDAGRLLARASVSADLVVVGSRGRRGLRRVAGGSVAERLTHHAACPVIVVPPPAHGRDARAPRRRASAAA
jgi:nucleotide-binding universal stress UspA family protein